MKTLLKVAAGVLATIYGTFALCMLGVAVCAIWIVFRSMTAPSTLGLNILPPVKLMFFLTIAAGILATLLGGLFGRFR